MSIQIYKSWQVAQYQNIQWVGDPFRFQEWLTLLPIRPYTDHDWEPSPHYPKLMKNGILQSSKMMPVGIMNHLTPHRTEWWVHFIPIWWFCNYCKQPIINSFQFQDQDMESFIISPTMMLEIHEWEIQSKECDYESLYTLFAWLCTDKTKCAFEAATQYARIPLCTILWKHYKLPFRGLLMYIIDKRLLPHIPCLQHSLLTPLRMLSDKLMHLPNSSVTHALVEICNRVVDVLNAKFIGDWESEPHYRHQNFAKRHWKLSSTSPILSWI